MKTRNLFWGIFFIVAAVAIILNQLGIFTGVSLINLVITILLIPIIIKSIKYINFAGILIPLSIIAILYADKLGIQNLTPWPILGAAIFLSIGLSFIIHPRNHRNINGKNDEGFSSEESINETDKGEVNIYTRFSSSIKYINSDNLKNANLDCSFGAMKVYLDNVKFEGDEGIIDFNISFSGVEIYVPKQWKIINNVDCVLAAIEEKNRPIEEGKVRVVLKGKTSFSGVEIIYI